MITACICYFIFSSNNQKNEEVTEKLVTKIIPEQQVSNILLDSFKTNLLKSYSPFIQITEKQKILQVTISKNNQLLSDFINQNKNVLSYGFPDNNFDIKMNESDNSILGQFKIQIHNHLNYVQVPNDVLFAMTKKIISQHE